MIKNTSMKAYMDKADRLIIVIDNPGAGLTDLITSFLGRSIPEVQNLDAPAPIMAPEIDPSGMKELVPALQPPKTAKFIQKNMGEGPLRAEQAKNLGLAKAARTAMEQPAMMAGEKMDVLSFEPPVLPEDGCKNVKHERIESMDVFGLQRYLTSRREDPRLVAILAANGHVPLEFILYAKTEKEIRAIAQKLAD